MKALIVISEINYIPSNCYDFLKIVLQKNRNDIAGVLIMQNSSLSIIPQVIGLYVLGCRRFATTLLWNMLTLSFRKRESLCESFNIPVIKAANVNDNKVIQWVKKMDIDLIINMRTRYIYKKELLSFPTYGCINIHHGLLPKYRGLYCDLYALYEDRQAGFSVHEMTDKLDDGRIIYKKSISSTGEKDYIEYLSSLAPFEADAVYTLINQISHLGKLPAGIVNADSNPIYTKTPNKQQIRDMIKKGMIL